MFTETVNTDLGELIDCDCLHQDSEQRERESRGGTIKPFNLSRDYQVEKTHMSALKTSVFVNMPLLGRQAGN